MAEIDFAATNLRPKSSLRVELPCSVKATVKGNCSVGAFSYIDHQSEIARVGIGRYCSIARNVLIGPASHPTDRFSTHLFVFTRGGAIAQSRSYRKILRPKRFADHRLRTVVGNDVWIGANVVIRRGVTVGDGAIIAAGAVVVKDVKPYEIVGGVPAKHIRFRLEPDLVERMVALQWWNYDLSSPALDGVDFSNIHHSVSLVESLVAAGTLSPLQPPVQEFLAGQTPDDSVIDHPETPVQLETERLMRRSAEAKLETEQSRRIELQLKLQVANSRLQSKSENFAAAKAQIGQLKKQLAQQQRELGRLQNALLKAEQLVTRTRSMLSFRLGQTLLEGMKSFGAFVRLPARLLALRRDQKRRKKNGNAAPPDGASA